MDKNIQISSMNIYFSLQTNLQYTAAHPYFQGWYYTLRWLHSATQGIGYENGREGALWRFIV